MPCMTVIAVKPSSVMPWCYIQFLNPRDLQGIQAHPKFIKIHQGTAIPTRERGGGRGVAIYWGRITLQKVELCYPIKPSQALQEYIFFILRLKKLMMKKFNEHAKLHVSSLDLKLNAMLFPLHHMLQFWSIGTGHGNMWNFRSWFFILKAKIVSIDFKFFLHITLWKEYRKPIKGKEHGRYGIR